MSNYTKSTNFATKDNLTPGDPLKVVRGTEIDTEYNNIATAIATKTDNASAAITGGTITGITDLAVADGGTGASTAAGGLNNLLPTQTGNANKYLQTDGTNATWDAVTLSTADITGTLPVANGGTGVTSSTGTGSVVLSNSPTLVTPALGTPASGTATNLTGLPISTGVSGLGTGVATFLATPSSANLASAVSDETGSGALVFANSPTLVTPALGTPSALVGTNITGTASGLTAGNVTTNANLTGAVTSVGNATSLGSFTSSQLAGALTDETGSGANVFATSPTLVTPILGTPTSATLTNATGLPLTTGVTGVLPTANGGTNLGGATPFTSGGVVYASSSSALATGSALTFDGNTLANSTSGTPFSLNRTGAGTALIELKQSGTVGTYLGTSGVNDFIIYNGSASELARFNATGLGIGTSSPTTKLEVVGAIKAAANSSNQLWAAAASGENSAHLRLSPSGASADQRDWSLVTYVAANGDCSLMVGASAGANPNAGTSVLTATRTGNIGIGTTTPASGAGADRALVIQGNASSIVPTLVLAPHVGNAHELISYNGTFSIYNSTTLQASLNNSGGLKVLNTIGVGNATPSSSGAGITFPATQSASSDANTLDDYEEGTWTPTDGSGASLSITFNNARYTKIGRLVYVSVDTIVYPTTANGSQATVASLPFANLAGNVATGGLVSSNAFANRSLVVSSSTTVFFYANASVAASSNAELSGATIYGWSAVYQTS